MKVQILFDLTAEPQDSVLRIYTSSARAKQDYELIPDKDKYLLKEFDTFPVVKREKKVK